MAKAMYEVIRENELAIRVDLRENGFYAELVEKSFTGEFGAGGQDFGPHPTPEAALEAAKDYIAAQ